MIVKKITILALLLLASLFWAQTTHVAAQGALFNQACNNARANPVCNQATNQSKSENKNQNPVTKTINTASNILAVAAGVVAVVMIIISGFRFVTAGGAAPGQRAGDPNRIKTARASLTYSVIGLVIVALAWTLVRFITDRVIK